MVGVIAPSSRLNSLGSFCYCIVGLGLHVYSCYAALEHYQEATERSWQTKDEGGTPVECTLVLVFTILSSLTMPFFCIACFAKVGNLANDQFQMGFHHALAPASPPSAAARLAHKEPRGTWQLCRAGLRRCWTNFLPISPFVHVIAAFMMVFPRALLTPVEVKYEYVSTVMCWSSELDFIYSSQRILLSDIKSKANVTESYNASSALLPSSPFYTDGRMDHVTVSVAFVNFSLALTMLLVRYASVFWYTNKVLALVFSLQLLAMVVTNIFSYCNFSVLYCVCYNLAVFKNVHLSIGCGVHIVLYLFSGLILILSSLIMFEYGANHFHKKFKIVERHYNADGDQKKKAVRYSSGCQGHVPHCFAMALLIALAAFKSPLLYDAVSLNRHTGDGLLLSGIVCDVCYMVLWVVLWFGLTVKQEWQFRILDFVPSSQMRYSMPFEEDTSTGRSSSQVGHGEESLDVDPYLQRRRQMNARDNAQRYSDPLPIGLRNNGEVYQQSDIGTEESDDFNVDLQARDLEADTHGHLQPPLRVRRIGVQRVTFDDTHRGRTLDNEPRTQSLPRQRRHDLAPTNGHLDVTADIHALQAPRGFQDAEIASPPETPGTSSDNSVVLTREYRNSLRNKCGEYYSSAGNINQRSPLEEPSSVTNTSEPLPTLMSSFRDKVRESSIAASNFKEREKSMIEQYHFLEQSSLGQHPAGDVDTSESSRRNEYVSSDDGYTDKQFSANSICDKNENSSNFIRGVNGQSKRKTDVDSRDSKRHNASLSSDEGHQSSSFSPSTVDSTDSGLPPVHEDSQLVLAGPGGGGTDHHPSCNRDFRHMVGSGQEDAGYPLGTITDNPMCGKPVRPNQSGARPPPPHPHARPLPLMLSVKFDVGRRDSANYSLTSSQDTSSSNDSEQGQGLCSQV